MKEPRKEDYGWHERRQFDDEPSGWYVEGGEEAYNEALAKYHRLEAEGLIKSSILEPPPGSAKTLKGLKDRDLTGGWAKVNEDIKNAHIPGEDYFKDHYIMGTDITDIPTFILIKRTGNITEVIMEGQIRDKVAFEEAVQNLAQHFNATILKTNE